MSKKVKIFFQIKISKVCTLHSELQDDTTRHIAIPTPAVQLDLSPIAQKALSEDGETEEELVRRNFKVKAFVLYNSLGSWGWLDHIDKDIQNKISFMKPFSSINF